MSVQATPDKLKQIFATNDAEAVVGIVLFGAGVIIATSHRVLYYGPDDWRVRPIPPEGAS